MNRYLEPLSLALAMLVLSLILTTSNAPIRAAETQDDLQAIWNSLSNHWVRYQGDMIIHKVITPGQEKHYGVSQYGKPMFEYVNPMKLSKEGNIYYYTKLDPETKEPIYTGAFKLHDDRFYEYSLGLQADSNARPQLWEFRKVDHPTLQLHAAAREGNLEALKKVLDSGVNADSRIWDSYTALSYAAAGGHIPCVELLLDRGANINQKSRFGKTPLNHAIGGGHQEACQLLIDRGADLNATNWNGGNLLHEAAFWGQPGMIPLLLKLDVEVDAPNNAGSTPLGYAVFRANKAKTDEARESFLNVARLLLENNADADVKSHEGESPRDLAETSEFKSVRALFK